MDLVLTYFEIASGISNQNNIHPEKFALQQNNPNPFNPTTNIDYSIPKSAQVQLVVYNILGQKIVTLVNQYENAGEKSIKWNGNDESGQIVSSGVYIYQIQAGDFSASQKMIFAK
jgi:flagellar hook assembly protein FlgD